MRNIIWRYAKYFPRNVRHWNDDCIGISHGQLNMLSHMLFYWFICRFRIVPILRQDICSVELPLEEYFVLSVADPRSIGSILRLLPTMPDSANHLKRIKDGRILIQPSSIALDHVLLNSIRDLLQEEPIIDRVQVPAKKPCTRRQFEWAKQRWPSAFHPNKEAESLLSGTFFNISEQEKIIDFYRKAEKVNLILISIWVYFKDREKRVLLLFFFERIYEFGLENFDIKYFITECW